MEVENKMKKLLGLIVVLAVIVVALLFPLPVFASPPIPSLDNPTLVYNNSNANCIWEVIDNGYMYVLTEFSTLSKIRLSDYTEVANVSIGDTGGLSCFNGLIYEYGNILHIFYEGNLSLAYQIDLVGLTGITDFTIFSTSYFQPSNLLVCSGKFGVVNINQSNISDYSSYTYIPIGTFPDNMFYTTVFNNTAYALKKNAPPYVLYNSTDAINWVTDAGFGTFDGGGTGLNSSQQYMAASIPLNGTWNIKYTDLSGSWFTYNTTIPNVDYTSIYFISNDSLIFQLNDGYHKMYEFNCSTQVFTYLGQTPEQSSAVCWTSTVQSGMLARFNDTILVTCPNDVVYDSCIWAYNLSSCSDIVPSGEQALHDAICKTFLIPTTSQIYQSQFNNSYILQLNDSGVTNLSGLATWNPLKTSKLVNARFNPLNQNSINIYIPELQANGTAVDYSSGNDIQIPDLALYSAICTSYGLNITKGIVFTELDLNDCPILVYAPSFYLPIMVSYNITNMSYLTNLMVVAISGNPISNVSELLNLPNLIDAELGGCPLDSNAFSNVIPTLLGNGITVMNDTPYVLTYSSGVGGTLGGINPQYVGPNYNGTYITASSIGKATFINWSDGSTQNPRIDTNVVSDLMVTANFHPSPVPASVSTMANMIAIMLGAVIIFLLLGFAFVEIKENGFSEVLGLTFVGILGIIVLEFVIIACL